MARLLAVTLPRFLLLVLAGFGGGLSGSIAGLASLVSYPTLLALGLPPVHANVTNTVALVCSSIGSVSGSRPELVGRAAELRRIGVAGLLGGAAGGALLLLTPADAFEAAVPVLIAIAAAAILVRRRLVVEAVEAGAHRPHRHGGAGLLLGIGAVSTYGGYFGAGAGVLMLALLLLVTGDPLPHCNAVKNLVLGLANGIAALAFAAFGPVRWAYAAPLAAGFLDRRPARPRRGAALAGDAAADRDRDRGSVPGGRARPRAVRLSTSERSAVR